MDTLAALLSSFDVSPLFPVIEGIAKTVLTYVSPVLLIMAIYIRLMETQVDALVTGGKYGAALRDILIWTFVLGSYFAICSLVTSFFNPIYAWLDDFGSIKTVMATFAALKAKNETLADNQSLTESAIGLLSSPYLVLSFLFYYASLIMLAFLTAFLKIANVLVFGVAFIWGLIAIPISISTTFKILKGWAYISAFALVWPIIQGLLLAMFTMLFTNSVTLMETDPERNAQLFAANSMMLFSVMHLLMGAVMIAAPFIANSLVTNTSSAAGVVMPFVGAAIAAGAGTAMATSKGSSTAYKKLTDEKIPPKAGGSNKLNSGPQPRNNAPVSSGGVTGGSPTIDAPEPEPPSAAPDSSQAKASQRRRGVMITQQKKRAG